MYLNWIPVKVFHHDEGANTGTEIFCLYDSGYHFFLDFVWAIYDLVDANRILIGMK